MGKSYLIATNIIIDFSENRLPLNAKLFVAEVIDNEPNLSIINKIELLGFSIVTPEIIEFTDSTNIINLTEDVASQTIKLRKNRKIKLPDAIIFTDSTNIINLTEDVASQTIKLRKNRKIKLPDAIIAATALVYNLTLISRNTKDFDGIDGLEFINPYDL